MTRGNQIGASTSPRSEDSRTARSPRPNIVIVLADDMGYSDLGCFGGDSSPFVKGEFRSLAHEGRCLAAAGRIRKTAAVKGGGVRGGGVVALWICG